MGCANGAKPTLSHADKFWHIQRGEIMQTIEITLDETMLAQIDRVISELTLSRSAFTQQSLAAALREQEILAQERRHAAGYARYPVEPGEFDGFEAVRAWGEPYEPR